MTGDDDRACAGAGGGPPRSAGPAGREPPDLTSWESAKAQIEYGLAAAASLYAPAPLLAWESSMRDVGATRGERPAEPADGETPTAND